MQKLKAIDSTLVLATWPIASPSAASVVIMPLTGPEPRS
jgi:hypothetical protein